MNVRRTLMVVNNAALIKSEVSVVNAILASHCVQMAKRVKVRI
uniref:Uncharacterized protein n=1 Tax=Parascaris equorum TaxID=6256 RepID=A0A914RTV5_PAREQ